MKVTRKMISAAHGVTVQKSDVILSADLLERIYLAMDALANHAETYGSPVAWNGGKEGREWTTDVRIAERWLIENPTYQAVPLYLGPISLSEVEEQRDELLKAIERMRVAGGSKEFQMAFDLAKDAAANVKEKKCK